MSKKSPISCLVVGLLMALPVTAQEEATVFDIALPNPGARSLGFGGAFVALADEAATAFSNPAGLSQFLEAELTLEARGQSELEAIGRNTDGLTISTSSEFSTLGFVAFVYPWKKIAVAIYRNGFGNVTSGSRVQGIADGGAFDIRTATQFAVESVGISGSYRWSETLSFSAGIAQWDGDFGYQRVATLGTGDPLQPAITRVTDTTTTDRADWAFNLGVLWRFAKQWQLGGVFRDGPEFDLRSERIVGPSDTLPSLPPQVQRFPVELPNTLGLGLLFRSKGERLTLGFEWDLVRYSGLLNSFAGARERRDFNLDDGHEIHLGLEYVVARWRPAIALRLGAWWEPDHVLRYVGDDPINRATFRGGRSDRHLSMGLGFAFKSLKLNFAFDRSELVSIGSLSLVYSF